ncbi:MAG: FxsA family protein [Gammaproteobacteria bacterium]|nr:MAG: FxsA family protein [Gammaproteobacteria bacterium]
MLKLIFFLFLVLPLVELYLLIEIGAGIGGLTTIALCLLTAAIGGLLVRFQGLQTLFLAQRQLASGQIPAEAGLHGMLIASAGVLLFLPGFVTDTIGFLLLIPALRRLVIDLLFSGPRPPGGGRSGDDGIVDAEIIEIETRRIP